MFVCTANICRSPTAEVFTRARLAERGIDCEVESRGFLPGGRICPDELVEAAAEMGADLRLHESVQLAPPDVTSADLVLTMERAHLREVSLMVEGAWSRTFTLKELVRRGLEAGARRPDEALAGWLSRLHDNRQAADSLGASPVDDVADPFLGSADDYASACREIDALTRQVVELLWPVELERGATSNFDEVDGAVRRLARRPIRFGTARS